MESFTGEKLLTFVSLIELHFLNLFNRHGNNDENITIREQGVLYYLTAAPRIERR